MHSFYEIFPDRGDLGGLFFEGGGVLIFKKIEIFWRGRGVGIYFLGGKLRVELFGWGRVNFFVCVHPYVKGLF